MRSLALISALLASALLAPACRDDEVPVTRDDRSITEAGSAAREARRASEEVRAASKTLGKDVAHAGSADASFLARRDQVVAQARTSLAAMDQKTAELESYGRTGKVKDAAKADAALAKLRDQRRVAAAALDDLAVSGADSWDTRHVAVETAFADLDHAYKDARDTMSVGTSTQKADRTRETREVAIPRARP
jgi:hypothetical protein